ncbi:MAG: hypothetical protein KAX16_05445, partial [Actinomycetia bacterium]|nr:hypothetical protein [Actinomycetes bacterium]
GQKRKMKRPRVAITNAVTKISSSRERAGSFVRLKDRSIPTYRLQLHKKRTDIRVLNLLPAPSGAAA